MNFHRKATRLTSDNLVKVTPLNADGPLPLLICPALKGVDLLTWAESRRGFINEHLLKHGAILFRNFDLRTGDELRRLVEAISGEIMEYRERSSPRSQVSDRVYTSTDYPADQAIFPHNEHSYTQRWPLKLFFFCMIPAFEGGETPLVDCRRVYQRIDPRIREKFEAKKWMYVRNYGDGFGLDWQTVFQTTDRAGVERYCRNSEIGFEWKAGGRLRTRQIRDAATRHPRSGELLWFNHATFFHISTLEAKIQRALLAEFKPDDLPNNTYYGDGTEIEEEVIEHLRQAYVQEITVFKWQKGDVVVLDNMLTAHGRSSYLGERKVLFAMSEPFERKAGQNSETEAGAYDEDS